MKKYVKITRKGYGRRWLNFRIHYRGARPKMILKDGAFTSGKNILEALAAKFPKFHLTLANADASIQKKGDIYYVVLPFSELSRMNSSLIGKKKDVTQRAIAAKFADLYPDHFPEGSRLFSYESGMFAGIFTDTFMPTRLSTQDREALGGFIPKFITSGVGKGTKGAKIVLGIEQKTLQSLAADLERRIARIKSEKSWQDYLKEKILLIQQGYIELITKANVDLMGTSYPDFLLITYDGYLDILEIKTPFTELLKEDKSHKNYYWSTEISKAIAQVENYIQAVAEKGDSVRNRVKDVYGIDLRVIKPRGIIFAGNSQQFGGDKLIQDDFRLLNQGLKNVAVVPYDELLVRLQNYITALTAK